MYSIMLYMDESKKTRMTFRIQPELARALRELPNQTQFVEEVLQEALGQRCPTCRGSGRLAPSGLQVSDFKAARLPRIDRSTAMSLREIIRIGRQLFATDLLLQPQKCGEKLNFRLSRADETILTGTLLPREPEENWVLN